jgi:tetratricopeptide (TPR) repeat protein
MPEAAAILMDALRVQGSCAAGLGRVPEAALLLEDAMTVAARATADGQQIPPLVLGLVEFGYGNCQTELGEFAAALDAFLGAAEILREIPGQIPVLLAALVLAAQCHRELDRNAAGLPLLHEAVRRCRDLIVDHDSATGLADVFTGALWELIVCQLSEDDSAAADTTAVEGIGFIRTWGLSQPGEATEATLHYVDMLLYHLNFLAEHGRDLEALPYCGEAAGILRNLAGINPDAFVPLFLDTLAGQIQLLRRLGKNADAAMVENEYARWAPR